MRCGKNIKNKKYLKKGLTGITFYMYIKNINNKDKI